MLKTSLKQKSILVVSSVAVTLVLIELLLRLSGFLILTYQDHQNRKALQEKDHIRILCVGESTTFLGGENSYPSQLEKILNRESAEKRFTVINKGVPGIGTSYILSNIKNWIDTYNPDIVVAMMGINDHNQYIPVDQAALGSGPLAFLKNLRVYKLGKWLGQNVSRKIRTLSAQKNEPAPQPESIEPPPPKDKPPIPEGYLKMYSVAVMLQNSGDHRLAAELYQKLLGGEFDAKLTRNIEENLGRALIDSGQYQDLPEIMRRRLKNPSDPKATEWIDELCSKRKGTEQVTGILKRLIKERPAEAPLYELLSGCYADLGDQQNALSYRKKAIKIRRNRFNPDTKHAYQEIYRILENRGIEAVFVQYPLRSIESLKLLLEPQITADEVVLVDNETDFREALEPGKYEKYFKDRFAGDFGHATPLGNAIIAGNIAAAIRKEIIP